MKRRIGNYSASHTARLIRAERDKREQREKEEELARTQNAEEVILEFDEPSVTDPHMDLLKQILSELREIKDKVNRLTDEANVRGQTLNTILEKVNIPDAESDLPVHTMEQLAEIEAKLKDPLEANRLKTTLTPMKGKFLTPYVLSNKVAVKFSARGRHPLKSISKSHFHRFVANTWAGSDHGKVEALLEDFNKESNKLRVHFRNQSHHKRNQSRIPEDHELNEDSQKNDRNNQKVDMDTLQMDDEDSQTNDKSNVEEMSWREFKNVFGAEGGKWEVLEEEDVIDDVV